MKKIFTSLVTVALALSFQLALSAENPCKIIYEMYKIECVATGPKSDPSNFSRASMGDFDYYSEYFNQNNFLKYCSVPGNPINYKIFKKDVCVKMTDSGTDSGTKGTSKNLDADVIKIASDTIRTRHGDVALLKNEDSGAFFLRFRGKNFPLGDEISSAGINKRGYKLNNVNVFIAGWAVGNAAGGSTLIIDRPDGVFIAEIDGDFDSEIDATREPSVKSGKISFVSTVQYKKDELVEFDGTTLTSNYDSGSRKWGKRNIPLKKLMP